MKHKIIELDCSHEKIDPIYLISAVIEGSGLQARVYSKEILGKYTWDYSDVSDEVWVKARKVVVPRIEELHREGFIRYGSFANK